MDFFNKFPVLDLFVIYDDFKGLLDCLLRPFGVCEEGTGDGDIFEPADGILPEGCTIFNCFFNGGFADIPPPVCLEALGLREVELRPLDPMPSPELVFLPVKEAADLRS